MSACTGASVTVPEASAIGAFGADGSAGGVVLSLARTTVGMFGATSFSAPLLTVAGDGLVSLILAGGGFVSLMCWTGWDAGCAGFEGASGCVVVEAGSCALSVPTRGDGMSLVVVTGCGTSQPARESESAMRIALATAAPGEPEAGRNRPAGNRSQNANCVSEGARSPE